MPGVEYYRHRQCRSNFSLPMDIATSLVLPSRVSASALLRWSQMSLIGIVRGRIVNCRVMQPLSPTMLYLYLLATHGCGCIRMSNYWQLEVQACRLHTGARSWQRHTGSSCELKNISPGSEFARCALLSKWPIKMALLIVICCGPVDVDV